MKIRRVAAESLRAKKQAEGQTEMAKLTIASRNFVGAPKKKFQKAPICSKNVFLRFGIFSGGEKNRHISVRHCNGDVIVAFRVATEFFHMTYVKFDFKWLTFENIPVTAAQWLLA